MRVSNLSGKMYAFFLCFALCFSCTTCYDETNDSKEAFLQTGQLAEDTTTHFSIEETFKSDKAYKNVENSYDSSLKEEYLRGDSKTFDDNDSILGKLKTTFPFNDTNNLVYSQDDPFPNNALFLSYSDDENDDENSGLIIQIENSSSFNDGRLLLKKARSVWEDGAPFLPTISNYSVMAEKTIEALPLLHSDQQHKSTMQRLDTNLEAVSDVSIDEFLHKDVKVEKEGENPLSQNIAISNKDSAPLKSAFHLDHSSDPSSEIPLTEYISPSDSRESGLEILLTDYRSPSDSDEFNSETPITDFVSSSNSGEFSSEPVNSPSEASSTYYPKFTIPPKSHQPPASVDIMKLKTANVELNEVLSDSEIESKHSLQDTTKSSERNSDTKYEENRGVKKLIEDIRKVFNNITSQFFKSVQASKESPTMKLFNEVGNLTKKDATNNVILGKAGPSIEVSGNGAQTMFVSYLLAIICCCLLVL